MQSSALYYLLMTSSCVPHETITSSPHKKPISKSSCYKNTREVTCAVVWWDSWCNRSTWTARSDGVCGKQSREITVYVNTSDLPGFFSIERFSSPARLTAKTSSESRSCEINFPVQWRIQDCLEGVGALHVYMGRPSWLGEGSGGMEYPVRKRVSGGPRLNKLLKHRCKMASFEAIIRLTNNFDSLIPYWWKCRERFVGGIYQPLGSGSAQCHHSSYSTKFIGRLLVLLYRP